MPAATAIAATDLLRRLPAALDAARPTRTGRVTHVVGMNLEVAGIEAAIGEAVTIESADGSPEMEAEVIAFRDGSLVCMPFGELRGVRAGSTVTAKGSAMTVPVGRA